MTTSVKYLTHSMRGAPVINGQPGSLIAALDALLVTGWGLTTALSVSVSAGVATATLNAGESFEAGAVVQIAGATPAGLNGQARVATASNSHITWACPGVVDGTASGTITLKYAPAGWAKAYTGTNVAAFRIIDPAGTGFYLRVDDTGTTTARVRGYEVMTDVDTGTGLFPTDLQLSGGGYWYKSLAANSTAVGYLLAADTRMLITAISHGMTSNATWVGTPVRGFGDLLPLALGDGYACALSAGASPATNDNGASFSYQLVGEGIVGTGGLFCARQLGGLSGSLSTRTVPWAGSLDGRSGRDGQGFGGLPNATTGRMHVSRRFVTLAASINTPRADVPGVLTIPHTDAALLFAAGDVLSGGGAWAGRKWMAVATTSASLGADLGRALIDITGPWREA